MATKSWFLTATTGNSWRTVDESVQSAANSSDGWIVSTGSANDSEYFVGVSRAAATFSGTSVPDGTLDTSNKDAFRTTNPLCGNFASASWDFHFVLRSTIANSQAGRIRFRLIKADADGSNAVEITAGVQTASTVTLTATGTDFDSTLSVNPGAFSIYGQYLFIQIAFERTGAGSMTTNDVVWRTGSSASLGTRITSSTFTEVAPPATQRTATAQPVIRSSGLATAVLAATMVGNLLTSTLGTVPAKSGGTAQPNPTVARRVVDRFEPVNLLLTTLAAVTGGDQGTTDQQTLIISPRPSPPRFDVQNLLLTTLAAPAAAPFKAQEEWPNTRGPLPRAVTDSPQNLLVTTLAPATAPDTGGFYTVETLLTRRVVQQPQAAQNLLPLLAATPFLPTSTWANPHRRPASTPGDGRAGLLQTTLGALTAAPFRQAEWPNPRTVGARLDITVSTKPGEADAVADAPFHQTEWPVTSGRRPSVPTSTQAAPLALTSAPPPSFPTSRVTAWPNPTRPAGRVDVTISVKPGEADAVVAGDPFRPIAWPNPPRKPQARQFHTLDGVVRMLVAFRAADLDDVFPNPVGRRPPLQRSESAPPLALTSAPAPSLPTARVLDWPNPRGRASVQTPQAAQNRLPLLAAVPFRPATPDVRARRVVTVDTAVQNLLETTLAPAVASSPFRQADWPVTRRTSVQQVAPTASLLETTLATPAAAPFSQAEWPNPVLGRGTVPAGQASGVLVETTLAPRPQFAQTDWPNPVLPRGRALTWIQSRPFYYEEPPVDASADVVIIVRSDVRVIVVRPDHGVTVVRPDERVEP
jgi:hypothetical protein